MAKEIIVLEVATGPGGDISINAVAWFAIPSAAQVPASGATSRWRDISPGELTAIQSGAVIEEYYPGIQFVQGTSAAAIKTYLVSAYNARAAQIAAKPNPNQFYGVFFDSVTGWSA